MILFRCDSSQDIGTGHVVRCLALAERYREMGVQSIFAHRKAKSSIASRILEEGFHLFEIPEEISIEDEIQYLTSQTILWSSVKIVFLDHYSLSAAWEQAIKALKHLVVIDDLADRKRHANYLINPNYRDYSKDIYQPYLDLDCKTYLGTQFSILRPTLIEAQRKILGLKKSRFAKCLTFFGGADPTGETLRFAEAVTVMDSRLSFRIIVSAINSKYLELVELSNRLDNPNVQFEFGLKDLAESFIKADFYFGSGGTITWERLYFGIPGVVVSVADNQVPSSKDLAAAGVQSYWGAAQALDYSSALSKLDSWAQNVHLLNRMREQGMQLVRPIPNEILQNILGGAK